MKKIGKNTKLYLIGMIIGGITLGITTVIADTIINSTSVAYKTTTVKAALDELYDIADFKEEVKDMLYPVGSIYISVSSTNPSQLFGGTWVSFGMGRTLMGAGAAESNTTNNFGTVTAGQIMHQSSEQKGGEYAHTLTENEIPTHQHKFRLWICGYGGWGNVHVGRRYVIPFENLANTDYSDLTSNCSASDVIGSNGGNTETTGGGTKHNNIQPYITVYMWKRTA